MDLFSFVEACQIKYASTPLPNSERWEEAHHPVPRCLGGTETVKLWRTDHLIHGLLQSEYYNHPCIFGDGEELLPGEYRELFAKWRRVLAQEARSKLSREALQKGFQSMKRGMTDEKENERRQKAKKTLLERNPSHFSEMGKKARGSESPEKRSERARLIPDEAKARGRAKTNSRKFKCLQTGRIMPLGPLAAYQKRHNIDPSLREEVFENNEE
jgi:hypothetical protein